MAVFTRKFEIIEPDFPYLIAILHRDQLYIGRATLITAPSGNGITNNRPCLSPCWAYRGGQPQPHDIINLANGDGDAFLIAETPPRWIRCDGLELDGITASMPLTEKGVRWLEGRPGLPFSKWIGPEYARLEAKHKAPQ